LQFAANLFANSGSYNPSANHQEQRKDKEMRLTPFDPREGPDKCHEGSAEI
jgi:hypothetical protein